MIAGTTTSNSYTGNNSTITPYSITFPYMDEDDLVVTETDADDAAVVHTITTDYAVINTTDVNGRITGGTLTTVVAVPVTSTLLIERLTPLTQTTDFITGGNIAPEVLETSLDKLTMALQDQARELA